MVEMRATAKLNKPSPVQQTPPLHDLLSLVPTSAQPYPTYAPLVLPTCRPTHPSTPSSQVIPIATLDENIHRPPSIHSLRRQGPKLYSIRETQKKRPALNSTHPWAWQQPQHIYKAHFLSHTS
ncbi:hypothetical protein DM02DRAFT_609529 [Periconia macrospinosa]|uniref:Uncharacterized protein n=1 Tax=Periconia macrospinosa TaxID=97972 RepID=A0A2V1EBI2_9PLEO|nr:hypothetical protein DM02DRAFT_609529 [Periconia macrospinosa]